MTTYPPQNPYGPPPLPPQPQPPYVPPQMGYQPVPPQPQARNGFGITALVTGIVGAVLGGVPILAVPALALGLVATVFGALALGRVRKHVATNKVMSWFGLGLGVLAIGLSIWGFATVNKAVNDLDNTIHNIPTPTYSVPYQTP